MNAPAPAVKVGAAAVTVGELRRRLERTLRRAAVASPSAEAAVLVAHACGFPQRESVVRWHNEVRGDAATRLATLAARRAAGEPLQYIVGSAAFYELELAVGPGAFIPRPETEGLAALAERFLPARAAPVVVDLFAGVGPLALYFATRWPAAKVFAVEADAVAAAYLGQNAAAYGAAVEIIVGDVGEPSVTSLLSPADLIVANPPYIPTTAIPFLPPEVREWEPRGALDGGADGLAYYPAIAALAATSLVAGGVLAAEVGEDIAAAAAGIFAFVGPVEVHRDLAGRDRYVVARKGRYA